MAPETAEKSVPAGRAAPPKEGRRKTVWLQVSLFAGVALMSAALGWWLASLGPMVILEDKTHDLFFLMRPWVPAALAAMPLPGPVTIVSIDAPTDDYLQKPRMLWPPEFGKVIRAAADGGAKVVGLDWYFSYPVARWDADADRLLFQDYMEVTGRGIPVVLAYERVEKERASEKQVPVYYMAGADGNVGYANLTHDEDTFIRKLELISGNGFSSFAGRVAAAFLGEKSPRVEGDTLRVGPRQIPMVAERTMDIYFYGPRGKPFPIISMAQVLKAAEEGDRRQLQKWFQNRVVLVGPDDLPDRHPTPFSLVGGLTEGVEIHANAVSTILNGDFLRNSSTRQDLLLVLVVSLLATAAGLRLHWPYGPVAAAALMAAVFLAALMAHAWGLDLPVVRSELVVALATVGAYGGRNLTQDRHRRLLESTFSSFVSREVLGEIMEAGAVSLKGNSQEVTVIFSDIRSFTTYSEKREPEKLVEELNEYFGEMAESITSHGGMVNKYIGDGIMALFGAPVPYPDHARRAVLCALDMSARLTALNQRRVARGLEAWKIGVGIHTGEAVVGNIGAHGQKMEYTAVGDAVNVASRVEGLNKDFGTQILLSLSTRDRMGKDIATEFKGSQEIRGRNENLAVYTVVQKGEKGK